MLLECGLPMSRETCVAEDGILAYIASTFAEDMKTEIVKALAVIC